MEHTADRLDGLDVVDCSVCEELVETRNRIVNGVGDEDADILFIGEAPGKNEDEQGEPFVGRSGGILDDTLETIGLARESVRITNTVRCRPEDNRDPTTEEISNCQSHLEMEIAKVDPSVIVPLGAVPTDDIIDGDVDKVTEAAGNTMTTRYGRDDTVAVVSVHPAATIYNRDLRPLFEETLQTVANLV